MQPRSAGDELEHRDESGEDLEETEVSVEMDTMRHLKKCGGPLMGSRVQLAVDSLRRTESYTVLSNTFDIIHRNGKTPPHPCVPQGEFDEQLQELSPDRVREEPAAPPSWRQCPVQVESIVRDFGPPWSL